MRLWLSKNSAASLRDQLSTQIVLGVMSGDLKPGEKLPSVRELARRYHIHSNTVSAAYRDLVERRWLAFKKGSGVYVADVRGAPAGDENPSLDGLIEGFFAAVREQGLRMSEVRARLSTWFDAAEVRRVLLFEPEPELRAVLMAELRGQVPLPVSGLALEKNYSKDQLSGGVVAALASRSSSLRAALPAGVPQILLRLRSVPEALQGQRRPKPDSLIAVASSSPEILRMTRTILLAAALDPEAIEFRDAREPGWRDGLRVCEFVICDVVTAPRVPAQCTKRLIRVLSDSSIAELRRFLGVVADPKVS